MWSARGRARLTQDAENCACLVQNGHRGAPTAPSHVDATLTSLKLERRGDVVSLRIAERTPVAFRRDGRLPGATNLWRHVEGKGGSLDAADDLLDRDEHVDSRRGPLCV
jgi:hypothetical protein